MERWPRQGSLPCSSSRTTAVLRPSGPPLVATPSRPFSRTCPRAEKARDDCKFTLVSPRGASRTTIATPAGDRCPTSRRRLRVLVAQFRMILSIGKPARRLQISGAYARARVAVQGRSLPRSCEEPEACAATRRVAVPAGQPLNTPLLPAGLRAPRSRARCMASNLDRKDIT
jgi:hypothetical protein